MSDRDPRAACDRLVRFLERAQALEDRGRAAAEDTIRPPVVAYAMAQLRMRVRPALEAGWAEIDPVHLVMLGGTNSGKSTILNALLGRAAAGMGARARLSQYPEAYRSEALGDRWLEGFPTRFAGYGRYRDEHPPRQADEEVVREGYRPALGVLDPDRLAVAVLGQAATTEAVLWDAPDFSTEEARARMGAVLDLLALADLIVLVVTDESYADARAHVLRGLVAESGAGLIVAANKLPDSPVLLEDIARTLGGGRVPVFRLPHVGGVTAEERLGRLLATPEARAFREAVAGEADRGVERKGWALAGAVGFVRGHLEEVLRPLVAEAEAADRWTEAVGRITREQVLGPYRREYLDGVRYAEFSQALVRVIQLLQVPGIGPVVEVAGRLVRAPARLIGKRLRRLVDPAAADPRQPAERMVLDEVIPRWLAALKAEAQALPAGPGTSPTAGDEIARRLEGEAFRQPLRERFEVAYAAYRGRIEAEIRRRAEAIHDRLQRNPKQLLALRVANLTGGTAAVALAIKSGGLGWSDAVVGPVVAGLWQNLLEWGLGRYLDGQREVLKREQAREVETLVAEHLARPVAELFPGAVGSADLAAARGDFEVIAEAVGRLGPGGAS